MKKNSQYRFLLPLVLAVLVFLGSCTKDDGPVKSSVLQLIDAVPTISTKIEASGSQAIDLLNLNSFSGKFTVSMYFAGAATPEKVDVVVSKNGGKGSAVKVFKAGVTTFPITYTVTAADLQTLFGAAIALGDTYDFSVDIYANGKKYEAFPTGGIGSGSGPNGMPGYSEKARFGAICAYDASIYQGDFVVVSDGWGDYNVGDVVKITQVSASSFSFKYVESGALPIIVSVNTANNVTSVTKQVYTSATGYGLTYGPFSVESVTSADNFVAPCDKTFSVRLKHTVAAGSFGDFTIKMKKK